MALGSGLLRCLAWWLYIAAWRVNLPQRAEHNQSKTGGGTMRIVKQLMAIPGVIAAGEYAYRGDRFSYEGALTDEFARMASILCRGNTLSVNMQSEIFDSFAENCGCRPVQGWIVRGAQVTVCAVGNYFSFIENREELLNDVMTIMRAKVGDIQDDLLVNLYARLGGDTKEALY
jgi:roadblock/LC7 domain-containing protein